MYVVSKINNNNNNNNIKRQFIKYFLVLKTNFFTFSVVYR